MKQENTAIGMPSVRERAMAVIAAGVLAASCAAVPLAWAETITPSAGSQSGSGSTEVTVQLVSGAGEVGGAGGEDNPDRDGDTYGDNIAFSVPASINFIADSEGHLTGPSNAEIQNHSKFSIRGSSLAVSGADGWAIVADASTASQANAIDFQIGPEGDMLDAAACLTKANVSIPAKWSMAANTGVVSLSSSGDINNVSADISSRTKVATLRWYVAPGSAS